MDRYSNGSYVVKDKIINSYLDVPYLMEEETIAESKDNNQEVKNNEPSLKEIDDRIMTIDDLLHDIEDNK